MDKEKVFNTLSELETIVFDLLKEIDEKNCKTILCEIDNKGNIYPLMDKYIEKEKIIKFIKEELPDDELMECCSNIDVNGVRIRKELEKIIKGE